MRTIHASSCKEAKRGRLSLSSGITGLLLFLMSSAIAGTVDTDTADVEKLVEQRRKVGQMAQAVPQVDPAQQRDEALALVRSTMKDRLLPMLPVSWHEGVKNIIDGERFQKFIELMQRPDFQKKARVLATHENRLNLVFAELGVVILFWLIRNYWLARVQGFFARIGVRLVLFAGLMATLSVGLPAIFFGTAYFDVWSDLIAVFE